MADARLEDGPIPTIAGKSYAEVTSDENGRLISLILAW